MYSDVAQWQSDWLWEIADYKNAPKSIIAAAGFKAQISKNNQLVGGSNPSV